MWNNCSHYLNQISQPSTPKSPSSPSSLSYGYKTLSPRMKFPHIYDPNAIVDVSLQIPHPMSPPYENYTITSPVYAYPYRMPILSPSPLGNISSPKPQPSPRWVYPYHMSIGKRFGLVPRTPRGVAYNEEEAGKQWRPAAVELVGDLSGSYSTTGAFKTRGIRRGPADEERMERFKIRTVNINGVEENEKDKRR